MTEDELFGRLKSLTSAQLDVIMEKLQQKIRTMEAERERLTKLPPRTSNDINALAEMQGLDLSGLMRDIKRHS